MEQYSRGASKKLEEESCSAMFLLIGRMEWLTVLFLSLLTVFRVCSRFKHFSNMVYSNTICSKGMQVIQFASDFSDQNMPGKLAVGYLGHAQHKSRRT